MTLRKQPFKSESKASIEAAVVEPQTLRGNLHWNVDVRKYVDSILYFVCGVNNIDGLVIGCGCNSTVQSL